MSFKLSNTESTPAVLPTHSSETQTNEPEMQQQQHVMTTTTATEFDTQQRHNSHEPVEPNVLLDPPENLLPPLNASAAHAMLKKTDSQSTDSASATASAISSVQYNRRKRSSRRLHRAKSTPTHQHHHHNHHHHHNLASTDSDSDENWSAGDVPSLDSDVPSITSSQRRRRPVNRYARTHGPIFMSPAEIEICQRLDAEYEQALEEREISYTARSQSVRQSAVFSVLFMIVYLTLGTFFFLNQAEWTIADSLLFSIYTITTVGYGNLEHPDTASFQLYTIFFIFIGIATLTIMVAQVYQCLSLEASRAQHAMDRSEMARRGMEVLLQHDPEQPSWRTSLLRTPAAAVRSHAVAAAAHLSLPTTIHERLLRWWGRARVFFREHEMGRGISVLLPFVGLITIGALVIGSIEQWSLVESLYFAVVSLTTVGFGDYYPTRTVSIWFCVLWLPFSVGFMSLYLANVAAFYIRLSDKNIDRIERQLCRQMERAKARLREEQQAARRRALRGQKQQQDHPPRIVCAANTVPSGNDSVDNGGSVRDVEQYGAPHTIPDAAKPVSCASRRLRRSRRVAKRSRDFAAVPTEDKTPYYSSNSCHARNAVLSNESQIERPAAHVNGNDYQSGRYKYNGQSAGDAESEDDDSQTHQLAALSTSSSSMATMRDVLAKIHHNMRNEATNVKFQVSRPESEFLSIRSSKPVQHTLERQTILKPSFALRVLVQERFSEIIATEITQFSIKIIIHENTLSLTIDTLKQTADKWLIPRRARKAFRDVTLEALYFVGKHGLVTRGADALLDLSPLEFHRLFAPLLAAMGDKETLEGWLASTEVLADVELRGERGEHLDDDDDEGICLDGHDEPSLPPLS